MSGGTDTVLLLGSGGREHALAWKFLQSPRLKKLYAAPGSDALGELCERVALDPCDGSAVARFARERKVDLVVVGPEAPLAAGVADALIKEHIPVLGPTRSAARLESSKSFAKDFMRRHGLPTAEYRVVRELAAARAAIKAMGAPVVVKADGLAAGKGVAVCRTVKEAVAAAEAFMGGKALGSAGETLVIEECLEGPEVSAMALCDGRRILALPLARDHKRLRDGDEGPNTGGMGAFAPAPVSKAVARDIEKKIFAPFLKGLAADGLAYHGVVFAGLMLTKDGPKVLEFNCRFGDPETQAVLPLLKDDLLALALSCAQGDLSEGPLDVSSEAAACVVLASKGYPEKPETGKPIDGLQYDLGGAAWAFHAGTKRTASGWATAGGRVLGVTALGKDLAQARKRAYAAVAKLRFEGQQHRKDIAL